MQLLTGKVAMPLLGCLLWVLSIHAGIFSDATYSRNLIPVTGGAPIDNNVIYMNRDVAQVRKDVSQRELNASVEFAQNVIGFMKTLENNLFVSNIKVSDGTPSHGMLISFGPEKEAMDRGRDGVIAFRATAQLMNRFCQDPYFLADPSSSRTCAKLISRFTFHNTSLAEACEFLDEQCSDEEILSPYRSINGSCNSLEKGHRGESFTGYSRLLYADYTDGVHQIRRSVLKKELPNARAVVSSLIKHDSRPSKKFTMALMQWSQFLEHDLCRSATATAIHTDSPIECCSKEGSILSPRYVHPFCQPIDVSEDRKYTRQRVNCLSFVRSIPTVRADCSFGASEQVNQATHYLDGSQIYGTTLKKSSELRSFVGGKLHSSYFDNREYLPLSSDPTHNCQQFSKNSTCFESGDTRVNFQPQLALMHTLWHREHNRIASELSQLNPDWNDEKLFQETRRIVIAEMQRITYTEWLSAVLGKTNKETIMNASSFNKAADASVSNSFATVVMRSIKSLSDGKPKLYDENRISNESIFMRNYFHNPGMLRQAGALDDLTRGLATQPSQRLDIYYADDLINQLYTNGKFGFDVLSFDVQRGRDHGLPAYVYYRNLCGLRNAHSFIDFLDVMTDEDVLKLKRIYLDAKDVDLMIGGLLEKPKKDSLFGPTFSCILADQMSRTRKGDRYFYDNKRQPHPFTEDQLHEIEKVTLARVMCDNSDNVQKMQKKVFEKISTSNPLMDCSDIPSMDLKFWQDY